jgi:cold shock CspA family protein
MRTHGTLAAWNDDRGFGFIALAASSEKVFVHISAFPRDGVRPRSGELVSFEMDARGDGKKRAVRVMRCGSRISPRQAPRLKVAERNSSLGWGAALLVLVGLG